MYNTLWMKHLYFEVIWCQRKYEKSNLYYFTIYTPNKIIWRHALRIQQTIKVYAS